MQYRDQPSATCSIFMDLQEFLDHILKTTTPLYFMLVSSWIVYVWEYIDGKFMFLVKARDRNLRWATFRKTLEEPQANMFTLYSLGCLEMIFGQNSFFLFFFFFDSAGSFCFSFSSVIFSISAIYAHFYQRCLIISWFTFQEAWNEFGFSMSLINKYAINRKSISF